MTRSVRSVAETRTANSPQSAPVVDTQEQIRRRAYELFEQRGCQEGFADQDWFQAEAEILNVKKFKAAA